MRMREGQKVRRNKNLASGAPIFTLDRELVPEPLLFFHFAAAHAYLPKFGVSTPPPPPPRVGVIGLRLMLAFIIGAIVAGANFVHSLKFIMYK